MSRSVPDTNIWVSGIRWRGRPSEIVRLGQKGDITLITSLSILAELTHVLRDYLGASDDEAYEVYKRIGTFAEIVYPTQWVNAVPEDPDDNKFVECALEGKAQYIISRDQICCVWASTRVCVWWMMPNSSVFWRLKAS